MTSKTACNMQTVVMAVVCVHVADLMVRGVQFGMRRLVGVALGADAQSLARSVIVRVWAVHGVILALVFAQDLVDYSQLPDTRTREAAAIADVWNAAGRYGDAIAAQVQPRLTRDTRRVIEEDRQTQALHRAPRPEGWALRDEIHRAVLGLGLECAREHDLRAHSVQKLQAMADLRRAHVTTALHAVNPLFWLVMVTVPFMIYTPAPLTRLRLSVCGVFSGVVMVVIHAFSDPFAAPGALERWPSSNCWKPESGRRRVGAKGCPARSAPVLLKRGLQGLWAG